MSEANESNVLFPWEAGDGGGGGSGDTAGSGSESVSGTGRGSGDTAGSGSGSGAEAEAGRGAEAEPEGVRAASESAASDESDSSAASAAPTTDEDDDDDDERFEVLSSEIGRRAAERAAALLRDRPVAPKEYYAISEVCDIVGLKPHVLRYWETQFQVLNPSKNRSGNRVYQRKEIKLILLVKHLLYEEKYTVEGAKARLDQMRRAGAMSDVTSGVLDREMLELLRADLTELAALLAPKTV